MLSGAISFSPVKRVCQDTGAYSGPILELTSNEAFLQTSSAMQGFNRRGNDFVDGEGPSSRLRYVTRRARIYVVIRERNIVSLERNCVEARQRKHLHVVNLPERMHREPSAQHLLKCAIAAAPTIRICVVRRSNASRGASEG
jgi:hypothetical protein